MGSQTENMGLESGGRREVEGEAQEGLPEQVTRGGVPQKVRGGPSERARWWQPLNRCGPCQLKGKENISCTFPSVHAWGGRKIARAQNQCIGRKERAWAPYFMVSMTHVAPKSPCLRALHGAGHASVGNWAGSRDRRAPPSPVSSRESDHVSSHQTGIHRGAPSTFPQIIGPSVIFWLLLCPRSFLSILINPRLHRC